MKKLNYFTCIKLKLLVYAVLIAFFNVACNNQKGIEKSRIEILQTEESFEKMAADKDIAFAFSYYADKDAVINRNDSLIKGKQAISDFYNNRRRYNVTLKWKPDFVEVSSSNDLAYSFGKYIYSITDSSGNIKEYKGIFHTVWKRQSDGTWKYVWD